MVKGWGFVFTFFLSSCSVLSALDGRNNSELKHIKTSYQLTSTNEVLYRTVAQNHPEWKDRRFKKSSAMGGAFTQLSREAEKWYLWGQDAARELDVKITDAQWRIACERVVWDTQVTDEKSDMSEGTIYVELTSRPLRAVTSFANQQGKARLSSWVELMTKKFKEQATR